MSCENTMIGIMPCPCTTVAQDETCPVGYPSLLCDECGGRGVAPAVKLDGPELWEIVFGIATDVAHQITDDQYSQIAEAINRVFIEPACRQRAQDEAVASISKFETTAPVSDPSISKFGARTSDLPIANLGGGDRLQREEGIDFHNSAKLAESCLKASPRSELTKASLSQGYALCSPAGALLGHSYRKTSKEAVAAIFESGEHRDEFWTAAQADGWSVQFVYARIFIPVFFSSAASSLLSEDAA